MDMFEGSSCHVVTMGRLRLDASSIDAAGVDPQRSQGLDGTNG